MPVEILIDENDTINAIVSANEISIEIITSVVRQGDTIRLEGLHLERLSSSPLDRKQIYRLCEEFCRSFQVRKLIVQGARRTTGKSAGTMPRVIQFEAE